MKLFIGICNTQESVPSRFFWSFLGQQAINANITIRRGGHPWDVCRNNQLIKEFLDSDIINKLEDYKISPASVVNMHLMSNSNRDFLNNLLEKFN